MKLIFLSVFFNGLLWLSLVPIWHTPDEQSHFGQVAYMAIIGRNPGGDESDLTEEIFISEQFLGTERDNVGNNKFTFHPEYRIEYTGFYAGKYEKEVIDLKDSDAATTFVKKEASRYPILYYVPASILYNIFQHSDLFTRVFIVRTYSLSLFLLTVYFSYRLAKTLFHKDEVMLLSTMVLVGFHPMMVFANIGVNSDAFGNMIFTLYLWLSAKVIVHKFKTKDMVFLVAVSILCTYVKPQFIITLPLTALLISGFIVAQAVQRGFPLQKIIIPVGILLPLFGYYFLKARSYSFIAEVGNNMNMLSFLKFTKEYTLSHTIREVMPWYWGIYNWLGVTYPRYVHRIINRIVFVSLFGFIIFCIKTLLQYKKISRQKKAFMYLLLIQAVFFVGIALYDWVSWYKTGFQLGVQGRYFFPFISVQMILLLIGWQSIFPEKWNIKQYAALFLCAAMIALNFCALYTIANTYYDLSSVPTFLKQASQYKPWFLKGNVLLILLIFNIVFSVLVCGTITKIKKYS